MLSIRSLRRAAGAMISLFVFVLPLAAGCSGGPLPPPVATAPTEAGTGIYVQADSQPESARLSAALSGTLARASYRVVTSADDHPELIVELAVELRESKSLLQVYVDGQPKKSFDAHVTMHVKGGGRLLGVENIEYDAEDGPGDAELERLVGAVNAPAVKQYLAEVRQQRRNASLENSRREKEAAAVALEQELAEQRSARDREEKAWAEVVVSECTNLNQPTGCDAAKSYLSRYPTGRYASEARKAIEAGAPLIAKLTDERDWRGANAEACRDPKTVNDCEGVQNYVTAQPAGAHADEARALLTKAEPKLAAIRKAEEARAERDLKRQEQDEKRKEREQCKKDCLGNVLLQCPAGRIRDLHGSLCEGELRVKKCSS